MMARPFLLMTLALLLVGCIKDNPLVPQIPGQQIVLMENEVIEVCRAMSGEFDHHLLYAPPWADSVEWSRQVNSNSWELLGTDSLLLLPVNQTFGAVRCLIHSQSDTIVHWAVFYDCFRFVLVPTAFDRWGFSSFNGWAPIINSGSPGSELEYLRWQVRSLDGTLIFETERVDEVWDGGDSGQWIGTGTFLYHIRVKFSDTEELVYTGMFVMLG